MTEAREKTTEAKAVAHKDMANAIRALAMDAVEKAKSGHPGMPMGMADVATVLFREFLNSTPPIPTGRTATASCCRPATARCCSTRCCTSPAIPAWTSSELKHFRQLGSKTAGHPEYGHAPGIETTTGPLGQGLANAVGMALAERLLNARLGDDIVDHHTYVIAGDGCLMEGISHEAISLAGHLEARQADRAVRRQLASPSTGRPACRCPTTRSRASRPRAGTPCAIDGHDPDAIAAALARRARDSDSRG